jgi:hypothetical protein
VYGPVRTVVWQGPAGNRRPYADLVGNPESNILVMRYGELKTPTRICSVHATNTKSLRRMSRGAKNSRFPLNPKPKCWVSDRSGAPSCTVLKHDPISV